MRQDKMEVKADAIAKAMVKAIERIEQYQGDPEDIMDSMDVVSCKSTQAVRDVVNQIRIHYLWGLEGTTFDSSEGRS